jgi:hypothetical protein
LRPEAGQAYGFAVGQGDTGGHGFAAAAVGFKEGLHRDDAVLRLAQGIAEAGLFGHAFTVGVVGVAGDLFVFGPMRDQAKAAEQRLTWGHLVIADIGVFMTADEGTFVNWPNIALG